MFWHSFSIVQLKIQLFSFQLPVQSPAWMIYRVSSCFPDIITLFSLSPMPLFHSMHVPCLFLNSHPFGVPPTTQSLPGLAQRRMVQHVVHLQMLANFWDPLLPRFMSSVGGALQLHVSPLATNSNGIRSLWLPKLSLCLIYSNSQLTNNQRLHSYSRPNLFMPFKKAISSWTEQKSTQLNWPELMFNRSSMFFYCCKHDWAASPYQRPLYCCLLSGHCLGMGVYVTTFCNSSSISNITTSQPFLIHGQVNLWIF
jgi:hypothetical protein